MTATGNWFYEEVHGKSILVKHLDTGRPPKPRRRARLKTTWGRIPHERGIELAKRMSDPAWAVLLVLEHAIHWTKSNKVKLSNDLLQQFEISRQAKARGLSQLEKAGAVTVERRGKAAPIVTHLWYTERGELK